MPFIPDNFERVQKSNYMKFEKGPNRIRILGNAIAGFVYWTEVDGKRKPVRVKEYKQIPSHLRSGEERAKHFLAFPVWNYAVEDVQLLEVTQATIQSNLESLANTQDWGDPTGYDITITKKGEKMETEYTVMPSPKSNNEQAFLAYRSKPIALEQLYVGGDPFEASNASNENSFKNNEITDIDEVLNAIMS